MHTQPMTDDEVNTLAMDVFLPLREAISEVLVGTMFAYYLLQIRRNGDAL